MKILPQGELRQKRPPQRNKGHLGFIAQLPCVICLRKPVQVAHVNFQDHFWQKDNTRGRKADDKWTVPLCQKCHTDDPDAQHRTNERQWWIAKGIDVLPMCIELWANTGNLDKGHEIILRNHGEINDTKTR